MKLIIGIIIVGIVIIFFVFLKRRQDEVEKNFQKRFAGKEIKIMDKYALYVAKQSDGYSHFRGSGYLVLTEDELYFERSVGRKIIKIPIGSIVKAEKTKKLGGQSPGKMMLKVVFRTKDGEQDAIAWKVKELEQWINEISMMVGNSA
ncbi:hypothetical protein ACFL27_24085 [candidate division CSSED10-310 bacterium]|uniref:GRAM domain-containing protein n=1 Tax=candidate division CSSED10-310 bacterium TaxID=2855610 RepID=A0ABV6Z4D0_UNCC1